MEYKVKTRLTTMVLLALMAFGSVQASDAVSEKDNFYQAVNGKTLAAQQIRPTEASWSWFSERSLENKKALGKELETVAAKQGTYAKGTPEQKIADLYACAIDNKQRNATARAHLQELTCPIEKAQTLPELTAALQAVSAKTGTDIFVGYTVDRLPTGLRYVPRILTVTPSFTKDELEKEPQPGAWKAYREYVAHILEEAGEAPDQAAAHSEAIFAMEKGLGPHLLTSEQRNDVTVQNRLMSRGNLEKLMPNMGGKTVLANLGLNKEKQFFLSNPEYLQQFDALYVPKNLDLLKSYAVYQVYSGFAPSADIKLRDLQRNYALQRFGIAQARDDKETASRMVQNMLSYEFGQIYMKNHCTAAIINDVKAMINEIRDVYQQRLEANDWLSQATRAKPSTSSATCASLSAVRLKMTNLSSKVCLTSLLHRMAAICWPMSCTTASWKNSRSMRYWERILIPINGMPLTRKMSMLLISRKITASPSRPVSCSRRSTMPKLHAVPIWAASASSLAMRFPMLLTRMAASTTAKAA